MVVTHITVLYMASVFTSGCLFCRRHPEEIQRMIPWLSRELFAILRAHGISSLVLERVLDLLPNHEIHSRQFWSGVETYLRHHCDHFIHEFYNFARSPYDMIGFDENAVYSGRINMPVCVIVMSLYVHEFVFLVSELKLRIKVSFLEL